MEGRKLVGTLLLLIFCALLFFKPTPVCGRSVGKCPGGASSFMRIGAAIQTPDPPKKPVPYQGPMNISQSMRTTPEILRDDGYPFETHYVKTSDNYILCIHRIPSGKLPSSSAPSSSSTSRHGSSGSGSHLLKKPVVFLHHGIACSSASWLINRAEKRLAYILADAGYDVWLGNARGNLYSRNHTFLDPNTSREFWNFSWNEIGQRDLPATIDYILERTSQEQLSYVGHSMGTTAYLVLTSALPSYNAKIKVFIGLAPVAFASQMTSPPVRLLAPLCLIPGEPSDQVALIHFSNGTGEFVPNTNVTQKMLTAACSPFSLFEPLLYTVCSIPLFVMFGFDYGQLDPTLLDELWGHFPQGSSSYQYIHYAQSINTGRFAMFDYGPDKNLRVYNSLTPPDYDLSQVTAPWHLYVGQNDALATPASVRALCRKLTNDSTSDCYTLVDYPDWNHGDFTAAKDVNHYINFPVVKLLNSYNNISSPLSSSSENFR